MAHIDFSAVDAMCEAMGQKSAMTEELAETCLAVMCPIVEKAQKDEAETMLHGEYYKGDVKASIKIEGGIKKKGGSLIATIKPVGTVTDSHHKKPTRLAEIAFINEYGKTNQAARPFIWTANEKSTPAALSAAETVVENYWNL